MNLEEFDFSFCVLVEDLNHISSQNSLNTSAFPNLCSCNFTFTTENSVPFGTDFLNIKPQFTPHPLITSYSIRDCQLRIISHVLKSVLHRAEYNFFFLSILMKYFLSPVSF